MTELLTRQNAILLAVAGSLALLLGAWGFQYLGGLAPCEMCLWQRWPHAAAFVIGLAALALPGRLLPLLGTAAALVSVALGLYHTGVERRWWEGPTACSGGDISQLSAEELFNQIMEAPLVHCDQVAWEMMGLSMASWNALISLGLAGLWLIAALKPRSA